MFGHSIRFIGCPKTIDNDLALTDHTPGYGSAAKYIGTSMKEIIRDSFCLEYEKGVVSIVEIMGRNAGWLTGSTALSQERIVKVRILFICRSCRLIFSYSGKNQAVITGKDIHRSCGIRRNPYSRWYICM